MAAWAGGIGEDCLEEKILRKTACYRYCYCILGESGCLSAVQKIGSSSVAVFSLTCGRLQILGEVGWV